MSLKEILLGIENKESPDAADFKSARLVKIYSPQNEAELMLIKSLLIGADIPYFVHNDTFGSFYIGPQIELYNRKTIMVGEKFEAQASELIKDFLGIINSEPSKTFKYSWPDKLRCFLETFIGGWVVPRKGFKKDFPKKDILPIVVNSILAAIVFSTMLWSLFWVIRKLDIYFKYRFYY